jgi:hypothetical protein
MKKRILSLRDYRLYESIDENVDMDIDTKILDELVELVGSEEDVEEAAKAAFEELSAAAESEEVEMTEEDVPEKLAIASLVVKLVEMGKLGPEEADSLIEKHLG